MGFSHFFLMELLLLGMMLEESSELKRWLHWLVISRIFVANPALRSETGFVMGDGVQHLAS